jgi:hypothetical protein
VEQFVKPDRSFTDFFDRPDVASDCRCHLVAKNHDGHIAQFEPSILPERTTWKHDIRDDFGCEPEPIVRVVVAGVVLAIWRIKPRSAEPA